ncbi:hypothetical protein IQ268_20320 [Oculatella sp. LEGE 06141]|uniref:hypothetical protein n=1 Tax=Oculatella sp. LEGE 06141 TaxID=1828648 RepID=UPI001882A295|nr:hypothetical protein [Oculatella sp. LEGE 06141]MBE9180908.1 hypothetical protein [Oculatella sp. LEGE 06141]
MSRPTIARRKFLVLGSAFSMGLLSPSVLKATRSISLPSASAALITAPDATGSIGFWRESGQLPGLHPVSWQPSAHHASTGASLGSNLVAADTLSQTDAAFINQGAKVHIQGMQFDGENGVKSLAVYAHYPSAQGYEEQKVCVWCFNASPVLNSSRSVNFVVPVSKQDGLKLSLVWQYAEDASNSMNSEDVVVHFSVDQQSNDLKLQRGVYLFAGRQAATRQLPDWQEHQLQVTDAAMLNQRYHLMRFDRTHQQWIATDVPYLLVTVDHGHPVPVSTT